VRTKLFVLVLAAAACSKKEQKPPPDPNPTPAVDPQKQKDDALIAEAKQWVKDMDPKLRKLQVDASVAEWTNETDITKEHEAATAKAGEIASVEITKMVKEARKFDPIKDKLDPDTKRQLMLLTFQAQPSPDDPKKAEELAQTATEMTSLYGKGVCTKTGDKETCQDVEFFSKQLQNEHDPAKLLKTWQTWHDAVGHAERDLFVKYVGLANEGDVLHE